ncbi:glycosyltransferase family 2 protein [Catalinimonas niigatensis]|uniref:glycosyltransferase family 2 protein n=1 Tax=Catalinimonas niigatensis TaxID=1397264 RepID=UPI0026665E18|nr:glycosyltransferase family 2 protein [Catalinimonas niigatensis]WPP52621.1 glycosyltransferase family 2 protein [Catalinimonas niigatensis]
MKISVLTPSYNTGDHLDRAIQSVLKQKYKNWEHIIVDGQSSDNTVEVLKKYPHLKWISEPDQGQSDAMNKAFAMSTGDIIVYLNADDWFEVGSFVKVVEKFEVSPDIDIVIGNYYMIKNGKKVVKTPPIEYEKILLHFIFGFPSNPVSYFYKREVQLKVGLFPIENHYTMDFWFLLNALRVKKATKIDAYLGYYSMSGTNKTSLIDPVRQCRKVALMHILKYRPLYIFKYILKWYHHFYLYNVLHYS